MPPVDLVILTLALWALHGKNGRRKSEVLRSGRCFPFEWNSSTGTVSGRAGTPLRLSVTRVCVWIWGGGAVASPRFPNLYGQPVAQSVLHSGAGAHDDRDR